MKLVDRSHGAGLLYVGGLGKEWTNPEGQVISRDPQFVKTIDSKGLFAKSYCHPLFSIFYLLLQTCSNSSFV